MQQPNNQSEFNALLIVIFVALGCMGAVSVLGGIYNILNPSAVPVKCSVVVMRNSFETHEYIGNGTLYE